MFYRASGYIFTNYFLFEHYLYEHFVYFFKGRFQSSQLQKKNSREKKKRGNIFHNVYITVDWADAVMVLVRMSWMTICMAVIAYESLSQMVTESRLGCSAVQLFMQFGCLTSPPRTKWPVLCCVEDGRSAPVQSCLCLTAGGYWQLIRH
jgi:hypothetical protein